MLLATEYLFSPLRYFKVTWAYIEKKTLLMNSLDFSTLILVTKTHRGKTEPHSGKGI
jgi:hypothetical protein